MHLADDNRDPPMFYLSFVLKYWPSLWICVLFLKCRWWFAQKRCQIQSLLLHPFGSLPPSLARDRTYVQTKYQNLSTLPEFCTKSHPLPLQEQVGSDPRTGSWSSAWAPGQDWCFTLSCHLMCSLLGTPSVFPQPPITSRLAIYFCYHCFGASPESTFPTKAFSTQVMPSKAFPECICHTWGVSYILPQIRGILTS